MVSKHVTRVYNLIHNTNFIDLWLVVLVPY